MYIEIGFVHSISIKVEEEVHLFVTIFKCKLHKPMQLLIWFILNMNFLSFLFLINITLHQFKTTVTITDKKQLPLSKIITLRNFCPYACISSMQSVQSTIHVYKNKPFALHLHILSIMNLCVVYLECLYMISGNPCQHFI